MQPHNRIPRSTLTIILIALLISGLSCQWLTQDLMPAPPADEPPAEETAPPAEPPAPAGTQAPVLDTSALNAEGPWLLIETPEGLWAANQDGTGMTQLTEVDYWGEDLEWAVQPGGDLVAFLSPVDSYHHMALNLLSLPDGTVTKVTDLTSLETEAYADLGPGEPGFEALRAIEYNRPVWSPDGTRLAFIGLMDGPSAEVYLYTVASGEVKRVSQDEAQNYLVSWSPDGAQLLYFGADGFGTGAGFDTTGVWSARGDGTSVTWLYVPKGGAEELVGWLDATTAVMDTWTPVCGSEKLRLFDIVSTQTVMLDEGCFISATAISWEYGAALFANNDGLYRLRTDDRSPVLLSTDPVARIDPWKPGASTFTVRFENGEVATYGNVSSKYTDLQYQVSPINASAGNIEVAEYGVIWAWTSSDANQPGAWITGPGVEIGQIYPGEAVAPIWDADNNLLFFTPQEGGGYRIYRTTFETFYRDLNEVGALEAGFIRSMAWLEGR